MSENFALALTDDETFSQADIDFVTDNFVCAVCHADLNVVYLPNQPRVLIVCVEHGNVCECGRVTRNTVSIELEYSYKKYYQAIRNLPDLWGELIQVGFEREHALNIQKDYVCSICGGGIVPTLRHQDGNLDLTCPSHGNINDCGYTRKSEFKYDFNRIREWNKNKRKG